MTEELFYRNKIDIQACDASIATFCIDASSIVWFLVFDGFLTIFAQCFDAEPKLMAWQAVQ